MTDQWVRACQGKMERKRGEFSSLTNTYVSHNNTFVLMPQYSHRQCKSNVWLHAVKEAHEDHCLGPSHCPYPVASYRDSFPCAHLLLQWDIDAYIRLWWINHPSLFLRGSGDDTLGEHNWIKRSRGPGTASRWRHGGRDGASLSFQPWPSQCWERDTPLPC